MNSSSKKFFLATLLLSCSLSFAQQKIPIKYYINNTESPIEGVRLFMVTKFDTITPKIEKGKMELTRGFSENFSLFVEIDGRTMKIGSYRPATFNEIDGIAVGRITDFSTLKKHWETDNAFKIDKEYVVVIPNHEDITDVIYFTVKNDINISPHSNFIRYAPSFQFGHEVIATKE